MPKTAEELDPVRKLIMDRAAELRLSLTDLSRAAGRNDAYVHQFIWRGSPKRLPESERLAIANALQIPAAALRTGHTPHSGGEAKVTSFPPPVFPPMRGQAEAPEVPVYVEGGRYDPDQASEWTPRPGTLAGSSGVAAVWVSRDHGRVKPGDMVYVRENQPPRPGDVVVAVKGGVVAAIGSLSGIADGSAMICGTAYDLGEARILKVAAVRFA